MPITGGGNVLAAALMAAEATVRARWLAMDRVLSPAEQDQMRLELKQAEAAALIAFLTTNTLVTVAVTGASGVGNIT